MRASPSTIVPVRDEHMLAVVRVDGIGHEHLHRASCVAIEPIHENGVQCRSLVDHIRLPGGRVDIDFRSVLDRSLPGGRGRRIACCSRSNKTTARLAGNRSVLARRISRNRLTFGISRKLLGWPVGRVRINKIRCEPGVVR